MGVFCEETRQAQVKDVDECFQIENYPQYFDYNPSVMMFERCCEIDLKAHKYTEYVQQTEREVG